MKVLVLCHGNKYRSPAAEAVLKSLGVDVESAGFTVANQRAAKSMRDAMHKLGFDLSGHRSRVVTKDMLNKADLILYMDLRNFRRLSQFGFASVRKARCLACYAEESWIRDPAFLSKDDPEFMKIVRLIVKACKIFVKEEAI